MLRLTKGQEMEQRLFEMRYKLRSQEERRRERPNPSYMNPVQTTPNRWIQGVSKVIVSNPLRTSPKGFLLSFFFTNYFSTTTRSMYPLFICDK